MTVLHTDKTNGQHHQTASSKPVSAASDAELIAKLDHSRNQLMEAAGVLRGPLHAVARAEHLARNVVPMIPYAVAAIAVIGVVSSLLNGKRVRPALVIATGIDVWRLWKSYKLTSSMGAAPPPRRRSIEARGPGREL